MSAGQSDFYRSSDLVAVLQEKYASGRLSKFREMDLLIFDKVEYVSFSQTGSELLFNVIADCYERQPIWNLAN
jgi:DNA replication protein DnaC